MMNLDQQPQSDAFPISDFESMLIKAVEKKTKHGNDGVGDNREKFNFYMSLSVHNLGCEISKISLLDATSWAAWMCNTELDEQENRVVVRVSSAFVAKHIAEKFGAQIRRHYQKPVVAKIDNDLNRNMRRM